MQKSLLANSKYLADMKSYVCLNLEKAYEYIYLNGFQ